MYGYMLVFLSPGFFLVVAKMAPNHTYKTLLLHHKETRKTKRKGRKIAIIAVFLDGVSRLWNQF